MKSRCICRFEENIRGAENIEPLYTFLCENAGNMDTSYLLRSEFVLIVSALDTYMHMIVEDVIVDSFWNTSSISTALDIPIYKIKKVIMGDETTRKDMFRILIRDRLKQDSFQSPKSIEYAFGLIGIKKIWSSIKDTMEMSCDDITKTLGLIVNRRNLIAHESDLNRATGELQPINLKEVVRCKKFIIKLVNQFENLRLS